MNKVISIFSSWYRTKVLLVYLFALMLSFEFVQAQSEGLKESQSAGKAGGVITGRVVISDGGGAVRATVSIHPVSRTIRGPYLQTVLTDQQGNFRFDNLAARLYALRVDRIPGYVTVQDAPAEGTTPRYCRVGDNVTINLIKGGVITGRVTDSNGEPVIGIDVSAVMRRNSDENPLPPRPPGDFSITDDRGIYRLYGLQPGSYIVAANARKFHLGSSILYAGEVPVYFPSSTIDTAVEIPVASGGEVTGADIRYLGERGHVVSGKVIGAGAKPGPLLMGASVILINNATGIVIGSNSQRHGGNNEGYAIYGVPDGEYDIFASSGGYDGNDGFTSQPRRITVKGSNLTGVDIKLIPISRISGKIILPADAGVCESKRKVEFEEIMPIVLQDSKEKTNETLQSQFPPGNRSVDEKGEFTIRYLIPSRYRLGVRVPDENLYLASIISPSATPQPGRASSRTGATSGVNLARTGITLKPGDRPEVVMTLANGASGVRGKIVGEKGEARLPSRMRVYLVPAEGDAADDLLRYAETIALQDGNFAFSNTAPGKYRLIARPVADDEPIDRSSQLLSWNNEERAKLRREAEGTKEVIELKPCQRVNDYVLRISF